MRIGRGVLLGVVLAGVLIQPHPVAGQGIWADWTKRAEPVFEGQYIASDPSLVHDGERYRMFYTCFNLDPAQPFDPDQVRAALCEATSADGFAWTNVPADGPIEGLVLTGREGLWDEHLEASFVLARKDGFYLYYSGYRHIGMPAMGFPAALAVAYSSDGLAFERVSQAPILAPTPGGYDNDAVYSPVIVPYEGGLAMIYAGHCYTNCTFGYGNTLLAATSTDGITWTKREEPVMQALPDIPWARDGVAEPGLLLGPDGAYYLFFTGLHDEEREIGVARGATPFGPWEVNPEPIVIASAGGFDSAGVLAPDVRLEGETVRMWFLGMTPAEDIAIGYGEAPWPLWREAA